MSASDETTLDLIQVKLNKFVATLNPSPESICFEFHYRFPTFVDLQHMAYCGDDLFVNQHVPDGSWYPLATDAVEILNRFGYIGDVSKGTVLGEVVKGDYDDICRQAFRLYDRTLKYTKEMEKAGQIDGAECQRVRESLQGIIPLCAMTERTTVMTLRGFATYMRRNNDPQAQPEIQRVAQLMFTAVVEANVCPDVIEELARNGWTI